ncbi:hypothetical protein AAZX31_03G110800 [Glycine max]
MHKKFQISTGISGASYYTRTFNTVNRSGWKPFWLPRNRAVARRIQNMRWRADGASVNMHTREMILEGNFCLMERSLLTQWQMMWNSQIVTDSWTKNAVNGLMGKQNMVMTGLSF